MAYYDEVIDRLQWFVMDIQRTGMLIDQPLVARYLELAESNKTKLKASFEKALGYPYNPNAPQQTLALFNNDFMIPIEGTTELELLKATLDKPEAMPVVEGILQYKDMIKKSGTYLKPVVWADNRVRSQFRLYGTLTWRLSSRDPDLQNLPRAASLGINIKDIYISPPGYSLIEIDYSALEDRIPAYASGATKLIQMFARGENTHLYRASIIFNRPITDKKKQAKEYDFAKRLRYATGYRAGLPKISDKLLEDMHEWHPPEEIGPMIRRLESDMPEITAWQDACWKECEKTNLLYDGFNTPRILYSAKHERRQVACSWPTQTTASGIMNRAMVRIYDAIRAGRFYATTRCVCQVHDSLLFEILDAHVESETRKLVELMEVPVRVFDQDVVFPVEAKSGKRWGSMETLRL
jgi:DNA polymerase-1